MASQESRKEQQARLLLELGFLFDGVRRVLYDPSPSDAKLIVATARFQQEFQEWTSGFWQLVTIDGIQLGHYVFPLMDAVRHFANRLVLPTDYPQKIEAFHQIVRQARDAVLSVPVDDPDIMVPPQSAYAAYKRLRALVATATVRVDLLDPYLDPASFLLYVSEVAESLPLRVITDQTIIVPAPNNTRAVQRRDRIIAQSELLANDRPSNYSFLVATSFHDRHLRIAEKIYHLGGSIAHASMRDYYTITETDSNATLHADIDNIIAGATPWYAQGMAAHRRA